MRLQAHHAPQSPGPMQQALQRHRFLLGALAIHGGLLWAASHWQVRGMAQAQLAMNQAQIQSHTQAAA